MTPPTIETTNYKGRRKYRLSLHSDMNGIYSREEIEMLAAEIKRILTADERAEIEKIRSKA